MNPTQHVVVYTPLENALLNSDIGSSLLTWGICIILGIVIACKVLENNRRVGPFHLFGLAGCMALTLHYFLILALTYL